MSTAWITGLAECRSHLAEMLLAAGHDVTRPTAADLADPSDLQFNGAEVGDHLTGVIYDLIAIPTRYFIRGPKRSAALGGPGRLRRRPPTWLAPPSFSKTTSRATNAKIIVAGLSAEYGFADPSEVPINEWRELRPPIFVWCFF